MISKEVRMVGLAGIGYLWFSKERLVPKRICRLVFEVTEAFHKLLPASIHAHKGVIVSVSHGNVSLTLDCKKVSGSVDKTNLLCGVSFIGPETNPSS